MQMNRPVLAQAPIAVPLLQAQSQRHLVSCTSIWEHQRLHVFSFIVQESLIRDIPVHDFCIDLVIR
jgi:hypothetical protein